MGVVGGVGRACFAVVQSLLVVAGHVDDLSR